MNAIAFDFPLHMHKDGGTDVLKILLDDEWAKLTPVEKAFCLNYRRQIMANIFNREMELAFIAIEEKYPDFHIGCMPRISEGA